MLHDREFQARIEGTYTWLTHLVGQFYSDEPVGIDMGPDPMGTVRSVDALRFLLADHGIPVPLMSDPDTDPLGCLIDWRDFLKRLVTVH